MASHHTRSLSFPAKPHPIADQLDEHLCRLRSSSQAASSTSLTHKLTGLKDLYECVDEFLQLPLNDKSLCEMLDGSLRLLDICATSRDVLEQSKERLHDIQSVLRRRCSGELNITNEIVQFQKTRKTIKKIIKKCLKDIKEVEKTNKANNASESLLKDVQEVTVEGFKSLLSYIVGSQKSNWSLSKLVRQRTNKETAAYISEFDAFDATMELMMCQKKQAIVDMSQVIELESYIQEIDEVLECLFRRLIKTRAVLLNVLSN